MTIQTKVEKYLSNNILNCEEIVQYYHKSKDNINLTYNLGKSILNVIQHHVILNRLCEFIYNIDLFNYFNCESNNLVIFIIKNIHSIAIKTTYLYIIKM